VRISGNQSSRDGARPSLIVLHTTTDPDGAGPHFTDRPGLRDLKRLGAWFDSPASEVSAHVANDEQGHDARYVKDGRKAWTEVAFNSVSLSIEQIGTDEYSRGKWLTQRAAQLKNTARWIAHWHRRWGIPIARAKVSGASVVRPGVATHAQLGSAGGGHEDPGPGYPLGHVLVRARALAAR
jgi:N-acetyl-anhydromuramyl-L-alanine amidase AmpD